MTGPKVISRGIKKDTPAFKKASDFFNSPIGRKIIEAKYDGRPAFQICIRDDYFNTYWRGCSVLRFQPRARASSSPTFHIHWKYIPGISSPSLAEKNPYVQLKLENGCDLTFGKWSFLEGIVALAEKGEVPLVKEHTGKEKEAITSYLGSETPLLLDLEVGFARHKAEMDGSRQVADRIDMARLVEGPEGPVLQMVEVKRVDDDRIRARKGQPKVMAKMAVYNRFLRDQEEAIKESYALVADNFLSLGLVKNLQAGDIKIKEVLEEFKREPRIARQCRLLVIGSKDKMRGEKGRCHWEVLNGLFQQEGYPSPELWSVPNPA